MSEPADREGDFRCEIVDYALTEAKTPSQAVMVRLRVKLTQLYQPPGEGEEEGQWHPWSEYDQEAWGSLCIAKKDGQINETGCTSLMKNAGWDGDFSALDNKSWKPTSCQVRLTPNEYQGKTSYQIAFVNHFDDTPGGGALKSVGPDKAEALAARYGSSIRALKGTLASSASPKPNGKPAAPKAPKKAPVGAGMTSEAGVQPSSEVPF